MRRVDPWIVLATVVIGACAYLAQTSTSQALNNPAGATRQLVWLTLGATLMLIIAFTDYRVLARFAPLLYIASVGVLLLMLVAAPLRAGTRSWLTLGSYTLQPSEFARVAVILVVAGVAGEHQRNLLSPRVVGRIVALVGLPVLLVALQPDLGIALTYVPILLAVLWLGGLPWRTWAALLIGGLVLVGVAWLWLLKPYQKERILTFADPDRAPYGAGYQQRQSKIAVGSGELTGKGIHSGTQSQLRFLPAQRTDFIFAVWAEETGFAGAAVLLGAYALVVMRIFAVAIAARDRVGAILAGATGFVVATEVIVNVAMNTGVAPTTGITLPLMSYGGSSVLATCAGLGLVLSVWRLRFANV